MLGLFSSEYSGSGTITFDNKYTLQAQFKIKLLKNGKIEGDVEFPYLHPQISEFVEGMFEFSLRGKENITGYHVFADNCTFESLSENVLHNEIRVNGIFSSKNVLLFFPGLTDQKLDKEIVLDFGITNVHKIPTTNVKSRIGILSLVNYEGIQENQKYMTVFKTPLVTSSIRIVIKVQGNQKLEDHINNAMEVVASLRLLVSLKGYGMIGRF